MNLYILIPYLVIALFICIVRPDEQKENKILYSLLISSFVLLSIPIFVVFFLVIVPYGFGFESFGLGEILNLHDNRYTLYAMFFIYTIVLVYSSSNRDEGA